MSTSPAPWLVRGTVRLFAVLADKHGAPTIDVPVPPGSTARSVLERIARSQPKLAPYLLNSRLARDDEFLDPDAVVRPGDNLSAIPPAAGG